MKKINKQQKNYLRVIGISLIALISISLITSIFTKNILSSFRMIFGSVYVLFLPGFVISYIFFSKTKEFESNQKDSIDWLERIVLSFALSIAIVPLCVFYLNLIGIKITLLNSSLTILGIILISLSILAYKNKS